MAETNAPSSEERDIEETPPPPLTDIRVRPPGGRGLNKRAIIITAGGACLVILGLASLNVSGEGARKPAQPALTMTAPARPEMAKGAVGGLPATYEQAAAFEQARQPPPQLGPPLPGDVAAFAPDPSPTWRGDADPRESPDPAFSATPDPAELEARQADRSTLFYTLRTQTPLTPGPIAVSQPPSTRPEQTSIETATSVAYADAPPDRTLFPGTVIPASLVTAINSEAPGPVIAQVTQTVFDSATGRQILIPQGARLIGDYRASARFGQNRIVILWSRLLMPDGTELALGEPAIDPSGAAAVPGSIDNHWPDLLGAAALGTLVNIGVASTEDPQITFGGIGGSTRDPVDQAVAEGVQRSASSVTSRVVDRSLAVPPTIRVEAGKRIAVMVSRRMSF